VKSSLSERDVDEDQKGTAETESDMNCWSPGCESNVFHNLDQIGDGTRINLIGSAGMEFM
jgi:hypothetical protein